MPVSVTDVQALIADFSIEITPKGLLKIGDLRPHLRAGTRVYVTYLAGSSIADTLAAVKEIRAQGLVPVPHIAVRNFSSKEDLKRALAAYQKLGVSEILLIAGAQEFPKGTLTNTLQILEDETALETIGLQTLGFAGHPEGHPLIEETAIWQALTTKQHYANQLDRTQAYLITQFCFLAQPVIDWCAALEAHQITMPVHIGIPGVASVKSLLAHARACGVGASLSFFKNNLGSMRRLMMTSTPDKLLYDLAAAKRAQKINNVERLHFYPLGGFQKTMEWIKAIQEGHIEMHEEGGFRVTQ